jgi:hypothetical protein
VSRSVVVLEAEADLASDCKSGLVLQSEMEQHSDLIAC